MKYIITILTVAVLFAACGGEATEMEHPQDLAGKKALLKTKKTEIRTLNKDIAQLEAEIEKLEPTKEKSRVLVTTKAIKGTEFNRFIEIQGTVQSDDYVMASSDVGGRIISLNAQEGQFIKKGALIAKLDLEQLDKQIAEIETSLQLAKEVYERQKRLWDQNIGSEMQLLQAENNKERLEKSLETIRFQQTKGNVYAPISGVVEMVMTKAGEIAGPGAPIVQILNTSKVKVVAAVPETYLKSVRRGEVVTVKFPALDREDKVKVSQIGRTINAANRTFEVEVNMNNGRGTLKPNLLALMMINDFSQKDALVVPLELVQQEVSGKDFVFVKGEGKEGAFAKKIYVKTGESYNGDIIITEGLNGGEELIVAGARSLSDNDLIEVDAKG